MFSSSEFPRSSQPDEKYSVAPLAGPGVYPEVSSLLDVPGRCSANFLRRWLKPPERRTTPLLHHFSTLVAAQINKSKALAPVSASLLPQKSRKTHKLSSFAFIFLKKSPGCFNLFPQGTASPTKREIHTSALIKSKETFHCRLFQNFLNFLFRFKPLADPGYGERSSSPKISVGFWGESRSRSCEAAFLSRHMRAYLGKGEILPARFAFLSH